VGDGPENVAGSGQRNLVGHLQAGLPAAVTAPVQDKAVVYLDWSPGHYWHIGKIAQAVDLQVFKNFAHRQVQRLVDHNAHGTTFAVFTDVSNAVGKNALAQAWHGQQEMIPQTVAASGGSGVHSSWHNRENDLGDGSGAGKRVFSGVNLSLAHFPEIAMCG
jgi:hypothetical protein